MDNYLFALIFIFTLINTLGLLVLGVLIFRGGGGREAREELRAGREESRAAARDLREELRTTLATTAEHQASRLNSIGENQANQLERLDRQLREMTTTNYRELDAFRHSFTQQASELRKGNEEKLEEMRRTVDEKLHHTLEKRLGESFSQVSTRLEEVYKSLGEMKSIGEGVGELKRVLGNVKARGTWAEIHLGTILEQTLSPGQYAKNVRVRDDKGEIVEYAIKLPGQDDNPAAPLWLPIDAKFPQEDYLRLKEASDRADGAAVEAAAEKLARSIRSSAAEIREKYLHPPATTDFGIMFLATEGLYAEVLRRPGLAEEIQLRHRVIIAGPTTITAILNSLRVGFQTLSMEKQATEVWRVLGAVKTEFEQFGAALGKVRRHLDTASRSIENTERRTRAMERCLREVEQVPEEEASQLFALPAGENGQGSSTSEPSPPEQNQAPGENCHDQED